MDILTAIESKIGECLGEVIIQQARYLFCFNSIVEDLEAEENNLKLKLADIKERVEREERNTKEIEKVVEKWLKDAGDVMADVQRLKAEIQLKESCLIGWCPDWSCRYSLSSKAAEKTSFMLKLQNSADKFRTVAHLKPLPGIEFYAPRDFMTFKATELASDQLIEALKNENTKMVGLYGAGGVGKTTLAKVVGQELKQQQDFDEVVIATVSQNPNILDVQTKLAGQLSLDLKEVTKEERAKRLYLRFTETKSKILVILDDVWKQHDLKNEFGIPVDDNLNRCKILITTRRKQACGRNPSITLGILEPEEGLALLKYHAGIDDHDSTLIDVSKEVAGECKGLPLAIVAVGSALRLRGKDVDEWNLVSQKLKTAELDDVDDVDVNVYACLKLSYDYLKDYKTKLCFLLCSLFPEDFEIDLEELVRYGVGMGWYQGVETIEKARSLFRGMIKGLKDSSLLLDTGKVGIVKMHDIVRDVAIWIGSKEEKFFNGVGLTEWPQDEGLKQCRAISLLRNKKNVLPPNGLVCPNLHTLLLGNDEVFSDDRFVIPDQFFEGMTALKVVNIRGGDLSIKSLQFLTDLQVLQLIGCNVRGMAFLGKLKRLQILSINNSFHDEIPNDLADELSKLKLLDLYDFNGSEVRISLIKRFSQLQEFYGRMTWDVEGTNVECLSKNFTFPQLQRYDMRIRKDFSLRYQFKTKTALSINNTKVSSLIIFSALYQNMQYLLLENIQGCQNISPGIYQRDFNELTTLKLKVCEELECIMDASQHVGLQRITAFPVLRKLTLKSLPNLITFCSKYDHSIWPTLQKLTLVDCPRLTISADAYEFGQSLAENLQYLKVRGCYYLCDAIVALLKHGLKNLKYLFISDLGAQVLFQLPDIIVGGPENELFPNLKELCLYDLPEMEVLCEGSTHIFNLQNLTSLNVKRCNRLRYLFSLSQVRSLLQLKRLKVKKCEKLKHIIEAKIDNNERRKNILEGDEYTIALPMLKELKLHSLPNLATFCSECYFPTWQALDQLTLLSCPSLTGVADEFVQAKNLQYLRVERCYRLFDAIVALLKHGLKNLQKLCIGDLGAQVGFQLSDIIVDGQESKLFPSFKELSLYGLREMEVLYKGPKQFFCRLQNLTSLDVRDCDRLRHLLTPTLAQNLLQLNELTIINCSKLEQIIEEDEEVDHLPPVCFPKLRDIDVRLCPKLKHLFHISVAPSLQNLLWLRLKEVDELEELFWHKDGAVVVDDNKIVMTKLWELKLKGLSNLTNCWPEGYQLTFPSLIWKKVENCPKLRTNFAAEEMQTKSKGDASEERNTNENSSTVGEASKRVEAN